MSRPTSSHDARHYTWATVCDGWRLLDRDDLSVIEECMPPGALEAWHGHDRARQFFYVLSGQGEMRTEGESFTLPAGTGMEILPGLDHQFANTSEADVRFLVISAPSTRSDRRTAHPR
jgi:mannose-6-phosphate isomerase-like protein (cupin superfamily)